MSTRSLKTFAWDEKDSQSFFSDKRIFITGGTGSLGSSLTMILLTKYKVKEIVLYSRDEFKQAVLWKSFTNDQKKLVRMRIGDVRDCDRLKECISGCDLLIHAAAMKHVDIAELNPTEAIKTNVIGGMNVIEAAKHCKVTHVVALSTDKACSPVNLYGATKLCSDSLFIAGNAYSNTKMSVVRYGNVFTSRGSVVPFFSDLVKKNVESLPVTHEQMTRFNISLDSACNMVIKAFMWMEGGELYVPKLPSYKILDLVSAFERKHHIVGVRPGEKLHEVMIPEDISHLVHEFDDHFIVAPSFEWFVGTDRIKQAGGKAVNPNFKYSSGDNTFLSVDDLKVLIKHYNDKEK